MSDLKIIVSAISPPLKAAGFKHKNKRNWYFKNAEVHQNIHLEKSTYSNRNWLDCYLSINRMDADGEAEYGIVLAIEPLLKDEHLLAQALDQDDSVMPSEDRLKVIDEALNGDILPTLRFLSSESAIVEFYKQKKSRREFRMNIKTAQFLGLSELYIAENQEIERQQAEREGKQA